MQRYLVEKKSYGDLHSAYFHDPESTVLSVQDYLEEKDADGWRLFATHQQNDTLIWIFTPVGRNS